MKNFARVPLHGGPQQHQIIASAPDMNSTGCMLRMRSEGALTSVHSELLSFISLLGRSFVECYRPLFVFVVDLICQWKL